MAENKQKIIDADLHVQDPHEIILSYFNTGNDSDIVKGSYKKFQKTIAILTGILIFMKFFFQEMFVTKLFTFQVALVAVFIALLCSIILPFFMRLIHHASKDGLRGIFYNIVTVSVIVLLIGVLV